MGCLECVFGSWVWVVIGLICRAFDIGLIWAFASEFGVVSVLHYYLSAEFLILLCL